MIEVCDIVEYGLDAWGKEPQRWRVTHHLKRVEDTLDEWKPKDHIEEHLRDIGLEFREEDRAERKKLNFPCNRRYKLLHCRPEEATHVSLVSICGTEAPISECKKVGRVKWSENHIKENQENAVSDFWLSNDFGIDWQWE